MQRLNITRKIALAAVLGLITCAPSLHSQIALGNDTSKQAAKPKPDAQKEYPQAPLNGVAAIVNDDVITMDQVKELTHSQEETLYAQYQNQPDVFTQKVGELRGAAVKELIDRQLILQEFKKLESKGATIPDYIVEDHIQTYIRGSFNGDRAAFIRTLDAQGLTLAKFKQMEKEKIIVSAMREREVQKQTFVPPRDVEEYYKQHSGEFSTPEKVHLRMISLAKGGATESTQKALAQEIRQKVVTGADFAKMAQFYSDTHAQDGGDYGWVTRDDINQDLGKIAFSLKPAQVSNVVDSSGSFWLLYVEARQPGSTKGLKEVRDDIEKKLLQVQQQQEQEKWLAGLRQKAYIKTF